MKGKDDFTMKKNAYLILAHDDIEHLKRLVKSINYECDVFIHLDAKKDIDILKKEFKSFDNLVFIKERLPIYWAGYNMVEATLNLIKVAVGTKENYGHLILISGNDYPTVSSKELHNYFSINEGIEIIRGYSIVESQCKHCINKVVRYHSFDGVGNSKIFNRIVRSTKNLFFSGIRKNSYVYINNKKSQIVSGSQWWAITLDCAKYVLETIEKNPNIHKYFENSVAPDEMFFHTIIFNSSFSTCTCMHGIEPYTGKWHWNNFHYLNTNGLECPEKISMIDDIYNRIKKIFKSKGKYIGSTKFFNEKDIDSILNTNFIFLRKVNTENSKLLLDMIDKKKEKSIT